MAQRIEPQSLTIPEKASVFPRIALFFDGVVFLIERLTQSLLKSKILLLAILLTIIFVCELIRIASLILSKGG